VLADEADRFFDIALGDAPLVGLGLNDLFIAEQGQRRIVDIIGLLTAHILLYGIS